MPKWKVIAVALCVVLATWSRGASRSEPPGRFQPTWESIRAHEVPEWFHNAKLGIFIHWGLYSVPAWATPVGELGKVDWNKWFANNPYAEWYLNTLRIQGSPTQIHHFEKYGKDFHYMNFAETFNEEVKKWRPEEWASLFKEVGARYVVLTSKHHDGWTLWPSEIKNPNRPPNRQGCSRDLVGELTDAIRKQGLRMGLYYSGGLDWSYTTQPIVKREEVRGTVIHTEEYARYADGHWRELIRKYRPSILWNDIGYPRQGDLLHIFADYYNQFPDGVVNNRFRQTPQDAQASNSEFPTHADFTTPEYAKMEEITPKKWESCRGLGYSFGYNQQEGPEHVLKADELIELFVDIVSKNGNLLLNIGPKPDGAISEIQIDRLRALGRWLAINGEATFDTRPWGRASGQTGDGVPVRFTRKGTTVYAVLFDKPKTNPVLIRSFRPAAGATIEVLGVRGVLRWSQQGEDLRVTLPARLPGDYAYTLKITDGPR